VPISSIVCLLSITYLPIY